MQVLSVTEAARRAHVDRAVIYEAIRDNELPAAPIEVAVPSGGRGRAGRIGVTRAALDRWIEKRIGG